MKLLGDYLKSRRGALLFFALLVGGAHLHLAGMNLSPKLIDVLTLPVTGTIGFLMVHYVSGVIDRHPGILRTFLAALLSPSLFQGFFPFPAV